jgi:hypothetical protein
MTQNVGRSTLFCIIIITIIIISFVFHYSSHNKWFSRHHGMARLQVADGRTASNMDGSHECIE